MFLCFFSCVSITRLIVQNIVNIPDLFRCSRFSQFLCSSNINSIADKVIFNGIFLDIQDCASSPCNNDGTCVEVAEGYRCVCKPGFTGANCEVEEDECITSPCAKGATCVDKV